jgi:hypothetical protein
MKLRQHHSWLIGFTDLAFLLLISLSLIPSSPEGPDIHLALMEVPGVPSNPNLYPVQGSYEIWELHVYGQNPDIHPKPFKLIGTTEGQGGLKTQYEKYLDTDELQAELTELKARNIRPVLIPSKTSLSHDFLYAAGAIARTWDNTASKAIVKPLDLNEGSRE